MADDSGRINQVLNETSFLYGANAAFVEDLYAKYAQDPGSVEPSWRAFFQSLAEGADQIRESVVQPGWARPSGHAAARPEWLSAIDGLWPAVEAKLSKGVETRSL